MHTLINSSDCTSINLHFIRLYHPKKLTTLVSSFFPHRVATWHTDNSSQLLLTSVHVETRTIYSAIITPIPYSRHNVNTLLPNQYITYSNERSSLKGNLVHKSLLSSAFMLCSTLMKSRSYLRKTTLVFFFRDNHINNL